MAFNEFLIGKRERMVWVAEATFGVSGTIANGEVIGTDCTIEPDFNKNWQEVLTTGNDNLTVQDRIRGPDTYPYTLNFSPVNFRWLKYLMACADGTDGTVKTHTFTVRNTILSYSLEWAKRHTTSHVITILGNGMKSATISFQKASGQGSGGHLKVSARCFAKSATEGSVVASVSALTKKPFQYRHVKLTLNNVETVEVNNGEMTIDTGIDEEISRYCNSTIDYAIGEPIPQIFRISGRFNLNIKDNTHYALWAAVAVISNCKLEIIRDASADDKITFTYSNFVIHSPGASGTNLEGPTNLDIVWTADTMTVVARDDVATY